MNSKHAFLVLSTFTLVSIAYGEREVFAPTKLAPTATAANGNITFSNVTPFYTGANIYSTSNFGIGTTTANILGFHSNGAERMRITSAGNVMVGNGEVAASVANGNIRATGGSGTNINGADLVLHGGQSTGTAAGGALRFFTAPAGGVSGTSVNASTERMRITADGSVAVGATAAYQNVIFDISRNSTAPYVSSGAAAFPWTSADPVLSISNTAQGDNEAAYINLRTLNTSGGTNLNYIGSVATSGTVSPSMVFGARTASGYAERMRIDSNGLIGVGTASPEAGIHVVRSSVPNQLRIDNVTTNATTKDGYIGTSHYNNTSEEPVLSIRTQSSSAESQVLIGGSSPNFNAATSVSVYTAANNTTTDGTERLRINSSGEIIAGNGDVRATPAASIIRGTNGTGTNISAANLTIAPGRGTGTGAGGALVFQTADAGTTGSTLNAATERMRITSAGVMQMASGSYIDAGAGKFELPNGTAIPATCTVGELFQDTDSNDCINTAGGDGALCICKTTNTWALISNF